MAKSHDVRAQLSSDEAGEDRLARRSELIISSVLRGGVILSGAIIGIGVADFYLRGPSHLTYSGGLTYPSSLPAIWVGLTHADPVAIIALGLIVLLATPVVRVAVSVIAFALSRDRLYVVITLVVLCILIVSLLSGAGGG
jgi:uncharacterized membrane protein